MFGAGAESFVGPLTETTRAGALPGGEPVEEVDAAVFFGRDAQIIRSLDALRGMRESGEQTLFSVLEASGMGKSSLLRAGVLPRGCAVRTATSSFNY